MAAFGELGWGLMGEGNGDVQLLARLANGEDEALAALYVRHGRRLFSYVLSLTDDRTIAEEIVQDTFVAAWRGAAGFRNESSVGSWLFAIARRRARDRRRRTVLDAAPLEVAGGLPSSEIGPEAEALAGAAKADLMAALRSLPAHHRETLLLAYAYEFSGPEIAAVLGIPAGTVKSRLHAARRALRLSLALRTDE